MTKSGLPLNYKSFHKNQLKSKES